jgi:hypothetical protein
VVAVVIVEQPAEAAVEAGIKWLAGAVAIAAAAGSIITHSRFLPMKKNAIIATFSLLTLILVSVPTATILLCLSTDQPVIVQPQTDAPTDVEVIHQKSKELIETFSEQLKSDSLTDDERRELREAIEYHKRIMEKCEQQITP